ncbi:2-amino-4-hydroxy-6-hydroxymethyldihydropteridine diphosphokinase [Chloroflexota bacterium]
MSMMHTVYIALGTNLGDRSANLDSALSSLPPSVKILSSSPVYETPPWGYLRQSSFLNQVVKCETHLTPEELLDYLKAIEKSLGRKPTFLFGPRTIDLDILFFDDLVLETPSLIIPHHRLEERAFVLVPLADLDSDMKHPVSGKSIRELLEIVDISGVELLQAG